MIRQERFVSKLPDEMQRKLEDAGNKFAEVIITGPEGDTLYFMLKDKRLTMLDSCPEMANGHLDRIYIDGDIYNYHSGDEVIEDICALKLSPRAAMSHGFLKINTDRVIYDTEEWAQAFEVFLREVRDFLSKYFKNKDKKDDEEKDDEEKKDEKKTR